jgi:hypothetical protein
MSSNQRLMRAERRKNRYSQDSGGLIAQSSKGSDSRDSGLPARPPITVDFLMNRGHMRAAY